MWFSEFQIWKPDPGLTETKRHFNVQVVLKGFKQLTYLITTYFTEIDTLHLTIDKHIHIITDNLYHP